MICKICGKEFEKKTWNQKYCSDKCSEENKRKNYLDKEITPCRICGFNKITQTHHIIKKQDYGSNEENNLIQLCPNHHKMADSTKYGKEMLKIIFEKTGKIGEMLSKKEIAAIENEIAIRVGGFQYKGYLIWHSTKMMLINAGMFYPIARSVIKDKPLILNKNKTMREKETFK